MRTVTLNIATLLIIFIVFHCGLAVFPELIPDEFHTFKETMQNVASPFLACIAGLISIYLLFQVMFAIKNY